jgi:putative transcriptional regulator
MSAMTDAGRDDDEHSGLRGDGQPQERLTGKLLVATTVLVDPNFDRTVVLVVDHDDDGTLGVVLNRPGALDVADVLETWADHAAEPSAVFLGGPVALDSALGIACVRPEAAFPGEEPLGWRQFSGRLGLVDLDAPPEVLAPDLTALRIFAGYAGWGPGQLVGELSQRAWYVLEPELSDVFTSEPEKLWREVLRRQGGSIGMVANYTEDPTLN